MCQSEDQSSKRTLAPSETPSEAPSGASSGSTSEPSSESGSGVPSDDSSGRSPDASSGPSSGQVAGPSSGQASCPSSGGTDGPRSRPSALPNAFSPDFLERLRTEHDHPPTPEAANAGPFRVEPFDPFEPLHSTESIEPRPPSPPADASPTSWTRSRSNAPTNAGPPPAAHRWACVGEGEEAPRALLEEPDFAYLVAAALPLTGRPPRFELVEDLDAEEDLYLVVSGCGERHVDHGWLRGRTEDLAQALTMLDELRLRPRALAHYLLSVGDETLARTGRILAALAAGRAPSPASPASQASPTAQTAETSRKDPER